MNSNNEDSDSLLHWNGWGFKDTSFKVQNPGEEGERLAVTGKRFNSVFRAGRVLPKFLPFIKERFPMLNTAQCEYAGNECPPSVSPPILNESFLRAIGATMPDGPSVGSRVVLAKGSSEESCFAEISFEDVARLRHAHGQTSEEMMRLRWSSSCSSSDGGRREKADGGFNQKTLVAPDCVIWPSCHEHVERIMKAAVEHGACIIPYGGGTNVTGALQCNMAETRGRMVVSLDMRRMQRVLWVDRESMTACIEAGAVGAKLEQDLTGFGLKLGHEPDSSEFSTLGGWVATRASGMKKNKYGNIEDIVLNVRLVTPTGTLTLKCREGGRVSTGPDMVQMVIGSEGMLGVVTEVVVRVQPLPAVCEYGSAIFPSFSDGVAAMREISSSIGPMAAASKPASLRLVDNLQFQLGRVMKPESDSPFWDMAKEKAQRAFVTQVKGFKPEEMVAMTLLFEGTAAEVRAQQRAVFEVVRKHNGMSGGSENGMRGYLLTYLIAYIRDFGMQYGLLAESFETSVPWSCVHSLCTRVKQRINYTCKRMKVPGEPFVSCRVTQTYDSGAAVYFYFAIPFGHVFEKAKEEGASIDEAVETAIQLFHTIETEAREEVLRSGGSLSHHHGVGKVRDRWMPRIVSPLGMRMLRGLKNAVDPLNVLCAGNLGINAKADINLNETSSIEKVKGGELEKGRKIIFEEKKPRARL